MTPFEPERYELHAGPAYSFDLNRREIFKLLGGGIVILSILSDAEGQESGGGRRRGGSAERAPQEIGAWLHIGDGGVVTVYTGKVEVGQNIRTSLTQVVCEELRVPMASVRLVMADTDLTPFDGGTTGSRTTPDMALRLRKVSAAAREVLIDLAAKTWNADRAGLTAANGLVLDRGVRSIAYSELTHGQKLMKSIDDAPTTAAEAWKICGQAAAKVDGRAMVTGSHKFTSDMKLPGMLFGKVLRPDRLGATLASLDTRAVEAMPGVTVAHDGNFVGVAAASGQAASRALASIRAEWKAEEQPSGRELFQYLKANAKPVAEPLAIEGTAVRASYTIAYIAHIPLEPRAAVAQWSGDRLTVWTGTQRPFGVRSELAEAFHIPESQVRVIVPDTGAGYGGKHTGEAALEAARLAAAAHKPVKLVWTREEEFTWAYFRPAGVIDVAAGVRADGTITAWEFHNYNSGASGVKTAYDIANQRCEFHTTRSPLRQGSYRALASTANHFARESHMDDLAHAVKMDPLEFRLKNLKDSRLRAVFESAAEAFGWGKAKGTAERGFGIAGGTEKGGYVATCAEVSISGGAVKVSRVVTAFECGAILNPDHLKNQVQGAMMMGIGGAMFEAVEFEDGKILNPRLSKYRVPRFGDMPAIEVVLVDRKDLPSAGAGESPLIALAPAIGNAVFGATGVRLRSLPMAPNGLTG